MSELPIEGADGWIKNVKTGSIQCADTIKYEKYMKAYYEEQKKKQEMESLQDDVSTLKSEMGEIKSILLTLVQNQQKTS